MTSIHQFSIVAFVKSRPTENPHNRFHDQVVTYDDGEGPPPAQITIIEDQSRSILAHND